MLEKNLPNYATGSTSGFVLLEALIAIAIFSFALLGLIGLQAVSVKHSADAKYRADAAYLANQIIGQMWVDRTNLASYAYRATETACANSAATPPYAPVANWLDELEATLPGVFAGSSSKKPQIKVDTSPAMSTIVTVTVCWSLPDGSGTHNYVSVAQITD